MEILLLATAEKACQVHSGAKVMLIVFFSYEGGVYHNMLHKIRL